MRAYVAAPRGFCAGVVRAIETVEFALQRFPPPIYVRKQIVHNRSVVKEFESRGVIFIDDLVEVPPGSLVIFSAHGVSPEVRAEAQARGLRTVDATCPLVTKVHAEARRFASRGFTIILIGHQGHEEVVGTVGEVPGHIQVIENADQIEALVVPDPDRVVCLTQTTLSVDETDSLRRLLGSKFPRMVLPAKEDICYATQNRQNAVKKLVGIGIDVLLVMGSPNSSNSRRLCDVAKSLGITAYLVDCPEDIQAHWLEGAERVGITAGASVPELLVQRAVGLLEQFGAQVEEVPGPAEEILFSLPEEVSSSLPNLSGSESVA
ncbi:MAG: 4-hydroxy-3-methylbut-2-enyl diphosphate reductase [Planctomycetota bacterium]|nr:4-hydroxy-3-methylbut-2-enyl diphosphate reductase [Planctomycetota bacterium]